MQEVAEATTGVRKDNDGGVASLLVALGYDKEAPEKQAYCLHLSIVVVPRSKGDCIVLLREVRPGEEYACPSGARTAISGAIYKTGYGIPWGTKRERRTQVAFRPLASLFS